MVENGKIYNDSEKKEAGYPLSTDRVPSIIVPEEILLKRAASAVHLFSLYPASLNSLFRNPHAPFPRRRADARASMPQRTPRRSTQRRRG